MLGNNVYKSSGGGTGTVSCSFTATEAAISFSVTVSLTTAGVITITLGGTGQITAFYY
jgi:hypothetical protein